MRAVLSFGIAIGVAALAALQPAGAQAPPLEMAVKAAYLSKFAPFIDWPANAFAEPASPLVICVLGPDPFGANLDRAVEGHKDRGHPVTVRRLPVPDAAADCHLLYVGDPALAAPALEAARNRPVVTVTEAGAAAPGVISFVRVGNNVRFDIDEAQAQSVGLTISSKLLSLARSVRRSPR